MDFLCPPPSETISGAFFCDSISFPTNGLQENFCGSFGGLFLDIFAQFVRVRPVQVQGYLPPWVLDPCPTLLMSWLSGFARIALQQALTKPL